MNSHPGEEIAYDLFEQGYQFSAVTTHTDRQDTFHQGHGRRPVSEVADELANVELKLWLRQLCQGSPRSWFFCCRHVEAELEGHVPGHGATGRE